MLSLLLALAQAVPAAPATPSEIVTAAPAAEWVTILADDLLVMELAPDANGRARRVVTQLMPQAFGRGWLTNIRTLARTGWWDGMSVNRVQDNYVAQWGDPTEKKPLPAGLIRMTDDAYSVPFPADEKMKQQVEMARVLDQLAMSVELDGQQGSDKRGVGLPRDAYATVTLHRRGWPFAIDGSRVWPVHCYATVGVGRNLSPDTGTGAELYAVIGHAPRHLDRNIAVVGRVVEGIEHLSSLPRGTEALGFYKTAAERVAIRSVRLASDLPAGERPRLQYLSTETKSFAAYANARANRRDAFFIRPAGGADICNVPVPVRRIP